MAVDVDGDVLEAAQFAHDPGDADPGGVLEVVGDGQGGVTGAGGDEARASGLLLAGDDNFTMGDAPFLGGTFGGQFLTTLGAVDRKSVV